MRKNCKTFEEWCESQQAEFYAICEKAKHLGSSVFSTSHGNILKCTIVNERTGRTGVASVKVDNFNDPTAVVIGLAWAFYKGEEIPKFRKATHLRNIENGAPFETLSGFTYIRIGYNPRTGNVICVPLSGNNFLFEKVPSLRVYKPR